MSWYRRRPHAPESPESPIAYPEAQTADSHRPVEIGADAAGPAPAHRIRIEPILIADAERTPEPLHTGPSSPIVANRPDTAIDGWSTDSMTVRAASTRGHLHRFKGIPRQDDYSVVPVPGTPYVVIAVADGVSNAQHSHIGSTSAARYATGWLSRALSDGPPEDIDWDALVEHTSWHLVEQAGRLGGADDSTPEQAARQVATTLVCCVIGAGADGALHGTGVAVGDSQVKILTGSGFEDVTTIEKEGAGGISSPAVHALPAADPVATRVEFAMWPDETLLIGSDGIWDPLGDGDGELGQVFKDLFSTAHPTLIEFARAVDFVKDSFDDDRTLVAVRTHPEGLAVPEEATT